MAKLYRFSDLPPDLGDAPNRCLGPRAVPALLVDAATILRAGLLKKPCALSLNTASGYEVVAHRLSQSALPSLRRAFP
jgi:hypothetical protein